MAEALTKEQQEFLGATERLEIVEGAQGVADLVERNCPELREKLTGVAYAEIRSSRFKACDHDWDELRFYDPDRTLRLVHVTQRKSPLNLPPVN